MTASMARYGEGEMNQDWLSIGYHVQYCVDVVNKKVMYLASIFEFSRGHNAFPRSCRGHEEVLAYLSRDM